MLDLFGEVPVSVDDLYMWVRAVAPAYAINVVRYYTPPAQWRLIVPVVPGTPLANLLIVANDAWQPGHFSADSEPYPRIVAQMRGVEVRAR